MQLSNSTVDKGDNQFLRHVTHEIIKDGVVLGNVALSFFDITSAIDSSTAWHWICRERQYLYPFRGYMFNIHHPIASYSTMLADTTNENGSVMVIDTIALDPKVKQHMQELEVVLTCLLHHENDFKAFMMPDWSLVGRKAGMDTQETHRQMQMLGFSSFDDFVGIGKRQDMLFASEDIFNEYDDTSLDLIEVNEETENPFG